MAAPNEARTLYLSIFNGGKGLDQPFSYGRVLPGSRLPTTIWYYFPITFPLNYPFNGIIIFFKPNTFTGIIKTSG